MVIFKLVLERPWDIRVAAGDLLKLVAFGEFRDGVGARRVEQSAEPRQ